MVRFTVFPIDTMQVTIDNIDVACKWDWDKREIFTTAQRMHLGTLLKSGTAFYITSCTTFKSGTAIAVCMAIAMCVCLIGSNAIV